MQKNMTPGRRKGCPNYSPEFNILQNWRLKMALMPICSLNGASSGARKAAITFL
jgi:hypothetical protein